MVISAASERLVESGALLDVVARELEAGEVPRRAASGGGRERLWIRAEALLQGFVDGEVDDVVNVTALAVLKEG